MKILLAAESGGHPFWQRNKYSFLLLDTEKETVVRLSFNDTFDSRNKDWVYGEVEYYIRQDGVYARFFVCGSGFGKVPRGDAFLIMDRARYDRVIIIPDADKREAERNYSGHWQDNSDFE
jgi:hypothetical protein